MDDAENQFFANDDAWLGAFYELALEIGERSDERLRNVLTSVWSFPGISGCYERSSANPEEQVRVSPSDVPLDTGNHLRGLALIPNGKQVGCGTVPIREDDGPDWMCSYIPDGSLARAYPIFDGSGRRDCEEIYDWFASIGRHVAKSTMFRLGLIGAEVSGMAYSRDIELAGIPSKRSFGYLWWENDNLIYYPATPR